MPKTKKSIRIEWIAKTLNIDIAEAEKIYTCRSKYGYFSTVLDNYYFTAKDDDGNFYLYRNGWKEYCLNADGMTKNYRRVKNG